MSDDSDSKDLKATRGAVFRKRYTVAPGFFEDVSEQVDERVGEIRKRCPDAHRFVCPYRARMDVDVRVIPSSQTQTQNLCTTNLSNHHTTSATSLKLPALETFQRMKPRSPECWLRARRVLDTLRQKVLIQKPLLQG